MSEDDSELKELLEKYKIIKKSGEYFENIYHNFQIFSTWAKNNYQFDNMYQKFIDMFDIKYRMELFENMNTHFNDTDLITDELIFYWKCLIITFIKNYKKYSNQLLKLVINYREKTTNFRLVHHKYLFKCFIEENLICCFKENGSDYYCS